MEHKPYSTRRCCSTLAALLWRREPERCHTVGPYVSRFFLSALTALFDYTSHTANVTTSVFTCSLSQPLRRHDITAQETANIFLFHQQIRAFFPSLFLWDSFPYHATSICMITMWGCLPSTHIKPQPQSVQRTSHKQQNAEHRWR